MRSTWPGSGGCSARRPGFAARFFTDTEQADARRSPDASESLAARFAAKEAVMKALGTGLGGFALTDVEVRRSVAEGPTANAPSLLLHGAAATLAAERGAATVPSLPDAHDRGGHRVRRGGTAPCVLPVLTRDEMRAADAAALSSVSEETLVARAGTAVGHAALHILGGGYGRHVTVIVGKGNNGADGRVAGGVPFPTRCPGHGGGGGRRPRGACPGVDLVIDGAYGTGFRGAYDAPAVPPGVPVLSIDIPSGVDADTGDGARRGIRGQPHRDVRCVQAGAPSGSRSRTQRRGGRGGHRHSAGPPRAPP